LNQNHKLFLLLKNTFTVTEHFFILIFFFPRQSPATSLVKTTKCQKPSRHVSTCNAARVSCMLNSCHRYHKASTRDNIPIPLSPSLSLSIFKSDSVLVIQCSKFDFPSLINDLRKNSFSQIPLQISPCPRF
jgi:hypothetical protein